MVEKKAVPGSLRQRYFREGSKKNTILVDHVHEGLGDLFLSLNRNLGLDAIGPETDLTIEKGCKKVVTRWSPGGHQVVTK